MRRRRLLAGTIAAVLLISGTADAGGWRERRVAAEAFVLWGDARRLTVPDLPTSRRAGLLDRIGGALAGFSLLLRQARDDVPTLPETSPAEIAELRGAVEVGDLGRLTVGLARLTARYPFDAAPILSGAATAERLAVAAAIHREHCAACHDASDPSAERPADDLFARGRADDPVEFAARLVIGIRGDFMTALRNPFGDADLAALAAYYRRGPVNR